MESHVDSKYEYNAPQFIDFNCLEEDSADPEKYFDKDHEKADASGTEKGPAATDRGRQFASRQLAAKKAGRRDMTCSKRLMQLRSTVTKTEDEPAPAKKQKTTTTCQAVSTASNSSDRSHGQAASTSVHVSGVRSTSVSASMRSSPRMLASTAASRSGARKLRQRPQSYAVSTSRDVSPASLQLSSSSEAASVWESGQGRASVRSSSDDGEVDFPSLLRQEYRPPNRPRVRITIPQPFNLRLEKRKRESETASRNCYKFDTPLGEKVLRFTSKTPERFKAKVPPNAAAAATAAVSQYCRPKTPKLTTKLRTRKVTAHSQQEIEQELVEEMKNHQFKAHPVKKHVLSHAGLGVKPVAARPATVTQPFKLSSGIHHSNLSSVSELDTVDSVFHAKPAPKDILAGVVGVKELKKPTLTIPQSPAFQTHKTRLSAKLPVARNDERPSLAHPMPSFDNPFQPHLEPHVTDTKPFSFDCRTQEMIDRREQRMNAVLEQEEKARQFHAQPMPDLNFVDEFKKPHLEPTKPKPYNLRVDSRGQEKWRKINERVNAEQEEQREAISFHAQPATVLNELPFEPQLSKRSQIKPKPFKLQSELRAEQRAEWERQRHDKELEMEREKTERESERIETEERELQEARAASVHVANPIRRYKPMPLRQVLPLTLPESPDFSDRFSK